jgi:hypothetical protein
MEQGTMDSVQRVVDEFLELMYAEIAGRYSDIIKSLPESAYIRLVVGRFE